MCVCVPTDADARKTTAIQSRRCLRPGPVPSFNSNRLNTAGDFLQINAAAALNVL